jgi:hypothetical protein
MEDGRWTISVLYGRPCFICGVTNWCRHREIRVEMAFMEAARFPVPLTGESGTTSPPQPVEAGRAPVGAPLDAPWEKAHGLGPLESGPQPLVIAKQAT